MITRKDFIKGNFKKRNSGGLKHPVSILLKNENKYAFTVKDITKRTKMKLNTIRSALRSLIKKGLIIHKAPYFIWKE
ncbi:MAG: hypothetical protein ACD_79C01209G0001 [uncultured bacterium]|nr:MAG: hypothetical protein ACD_79C01209G0001 [uncultured bacterium]